MGERKSLGIIGGLGPAATAYLFSRVVDLTDASCDQEHLDITVLNRPRTPDRTAYLLGRSDEDFVPALLHSVEQLAGLGCEVVCIGCVTAHAAYDQLRDRAARTCPGVRVLNLLDLMADDLAAHGCRRAGLLATCGTIETRVLQRTVEARGIEVRVPDAEHQEFVTSIIYDQVKAGLPADMGAFERVCAFLAREGCDGVVLGCTELPLIGAPEVCHGMYVANSLDILARAAVVACGARVKEV